jgi:2-dehydro-3-deoxyphosphogluconate aldolase/(4S)-4-hydroxy-2-oxoglutarate aldolase
MAARSVSDTIQLIQQHGVIAVVSAPRAEHLLDWGLAVAKGGIKLLGIPATYPDVAEVTSDLADEANLCVGVTGVISEDHVMVAVAAGAAFVISPICRPAIIAAARSRGLAVIAGGGSPTEIGRCIAERPDLVTVFPAAGLGGPRYFERIVPLFPTMPLLASGGVDVESAPAYLESGAVAAIVDAGIFPTAEDPSATSVITTRAAALTEVCNDAMGHFGRASMTEILVKST